MRTEKGPDFRQYLTLYSQERFPDKFVTNEQIAIIAETGHGKTVAEEKIIETYHKHGYCVIVLTEKPKSPFELGFAAFKPKHEYHKKLLRMQSQTPDKKPIKLYHPATLKLPNNKLPPIHFFTIPIRSISSQELTILLEVESRNFSVNILSNVINRLDKTAGFLDLIWQADDAIRKHSQQVTKGKSVASFDDEFFVQVPEAGTTKNISHIVSTFRPFQDHYFLANDESPRNLDWKALLADNQHYHIFSTHWIKEKRLKYFVVNWLLNQIEEHKEHKQHPILLVVQEAKVFLPEKDEDKFVQKTAANFTEKLSTMRTSGISSVADSQGYYELAEGYRKSVNQLFIGSLNVDDLERYAKAIRLPSQIKEKMAKLPKNTYYLKGSTKQYAVLFPTHAHKEEGETFLAEWQAHYPETMQQYTNLIRELTTLKLSDQKAAQQRKADRLQHLRDEESAKDAAKQPKVATEKIKAQKEKLVEATSKAERSTMILVYEQSRLNPNNANPPSWSKLGALHGITDKTAKTWAQKGQALSQTPEPESPPDLADKPLNQGPFYKDPART